MLYFASSNQGKLTRLQKLFSRLDPNLPIQFVPDYIEVEENGRDGRENSQKKILPYVDQYPYPVLSQDTAVFFSGEDFDPTHVRRVALGEKNEKDLTPEQIAALMEKFYIDLANKYGGQKDFYYIDYWTLLQPDGQIDQIENKREYTLTSQPHGPIDIHLPMRHLYISKTTGKYFHDQTAEEYFLELSPQIVALKQLFYS
ncbi:MAG: non-canonical purine NTP pyrophosphatase [Patescibacteria group bacterium]